MIDSTNGRGESGYNAWLRPVPRTEARVHPCVIRLRIPRTPVVETAIVELVRIAHTAWSLEPTVVDDQNGPSHSDDSPQIELSRSQGGGPGSYAIRAAGGSPWLALRISAPDDAGLLYAAFHLVHLAALGVEPDSLDVHESPAYPIRMLDHWDNVTGVVERGYAGRSIFFNDGHLVADRNRITDYARLVSSVGINAVAANNVNVTRAAALLITEYLDELVALADLLRPYAISLFASIDYSSPISLGGLSTADPLDPEVAAFWRERADAIYERIPDFGGFLVKADSENRPGPFTYGRDHAQGANVLARALAPHGGTVIWRAFVYNCHQDWRDRSTDRARAAYDAFVPIDGDFDDNVVVQIKNGPVDFQVREPVSPLLAAMPQTKTFLELQVTQEYTGQQIDLCYLVPQWRTVFADLERIGVNRNARRAGIAAVANIGADENWTGHHLAQANLYGYARLAWNPDLDSDAIAREWIGLTFGTDETIVDPIRKILLGSWPTYERYNAPLGVGWMCNPAYHYGPNPDGYEYSAWGTYHFADRNGIGVDRTVATGTGYTAQYPESLAQEYESIQTCPDELLLFFHHVPYSHRLKSGSTVIQHIYETHFRGAQEVRDMRDAWAALVHRIDARRHEEVLARFNRQLENAELWRDVINTYFFRKSGIPDAEGRPIHP